MVQVFKTIEMYEILILLLSSILITLVIYENRHMSPNYDVIAMPTRCSLCWALVLVIIIVADLLVLHNITQHPHGVLWAMVNNL